MPMVYTWIQRRLMLCMPSQHPQMSLNSKSSLECWHISAHSSVACPPWLPLCENWEKMTSPGIPAMRLLLSKSSKLLSVTPPSDTSTLTACDHTSQCFPGRSRCSTPTEQKTCSFCKQSTHWCRMQICKHRERDASHCLWSRAILHLCLWMVLHNQSDHIPLESIFRKNLADMPAWLQCMMLCLQGYDLTIHYCPGKEMVIPDTLFQFSPQPGPSFPLDITIHHAHIVTTCKEAFQQAFISDPEMRALANLIITGWPEDIKEVLVPSICTGNTETLTIEDGLVLWSEALIHSSCQKGESPASTASIPSRN